MKDKRIEKIKKHYEILINGKKVKIINHMIDEKEIRLITKIKGQSFPFDECVRIEIPKQGTLYGKWACGGISAQTEEYRYKMIEKIES